MSYRALALLASLGMVLIGSAHVSAQEAEPIPGGRLCRLSQLIEAHQRPAFEAAAVTLLPADTVLWMGDAPLPVFQAVPADRLDEVFVFASAAGVPKSLGVTFLYKEAHAKPEQLHILSVNPYFF